MGGNLHHTKIEMIDSFTPGGIRNWNNFCRYATIEAFASSDPTKINHYLKEIIQYISNGVNDKAISAINNLMFSFSNSLKLENTRQMSFASLVKSIDGQFVQNEPVEKIMEILKELPVSEMENKLESTKKKSKKN